MKNKRYKAIPNMTVKGYLIYPVIDTFTGEWICVKDCQLWAERAACKLNKEWEGVKSDNDCESKT